MASWLGTCDWGQNEQRHLTEASKQQVVDSAGLIKKD